MRYFKITQIDESEYAKIAKHVPLTGKQHKEIVDETCYIAIDDDEELSINVNLLDDNK